MNHFPGPGRTMSNLEIIAPDYHEAFRGLYDSEFVELVSITIQEPGRNFFPTIGDLKRIEEGMGSYNNPYGGTGGLPFTEDVPGIKDLMAAAAKNEKMSPEDKKALDELLERIGKEV